MEEPETLAHWVDWRPLATRQGGVSGLVYLSRLPRVAAELARDADTQAVVSATLRFDEDAQRRVRVAGTIRTTLRLLCQRCLNAFDEPMVVAVAAVVVSDDEAAANVPRADEPIVANADTLDIYALVSDELLLAMPNVARCDRAACLARYEHSAPARQPARGGQNKNPFAALGALKRDPD